MPRVAVTFTVISYIALVTTLLQFLIRVNAIFSDVRFAQWFFTCLWILASGGTSLLILGVSNSGICNSDYSFYVPVISVLVHDSCVFVAISYRIYEISMAFPKRSLPETSTNANQFKVLETLWGKNLPSLSRALLRNGQIYYLLSFHGTKVEPGTSVHDDLQNILNMQHFDPLAHARYIPPTTRATLTCTNACCCD